MAAGSSARIRELEAEVSRLTAEVERLKAEHAQVAIAEQLRIAQALHDTISQSLVGIHLRAAVLAKKLQAEHPEAAAQVTELGDVIHRAGGELHELMCSLRSVER